MSKPRKGVVWFSAFGRWQVWDEQFRIVHAQAGTMDKDSALHAVEVAFPRSRVTLGQWRQHGGGYEFEAREQFVVKSCSSS